MTAAITKAELKGVLTSKFGFEPREGRRHEKLTLSCGGKKIATTFFSRKLRSSVLGPPLLRKIAGQIRLTPPEALGTIRGMVSCDVSREDYYKILEEGGFLD